MDLDHADARYRRDRAVLVDEQVYGASLGLNYEPDDVYLTHMTAIKPAYRGLGLGTLIRRLQTASKPRFVASLSAHHANISDDGKTAVDAQISMMRACGYERVGAQDRAHEMIRLLDLECKSLYLMHTLQRGFVTPLLFERVVNDGAPTHDVSDSLDPDRLSSEDILRMSDACLTDLIDDRTERMGTAASNDLRSDNDPNEPSGDLLDMSDAEIDERLRPPDQSINMSAADVEQALAHLDE